MSTPIVRRRKRPVEVDTIQWLGDNETDVMAFAGGGAYFYALDPEDRANSDDPEATATVYDRLHSTWILVSTGQHIVRGVKHELYPLAEDVADDTYDEVDTNFFQPGHTYTDDRGFRFECLAVAPTPWDGTPRAIGYLTHPDGSGHVHGLTGEQWDSGDWNDTTDTTTGDHT